MYILSFLVFAPTKNFRVDLWLPFKILVASLKNHSHIPMLLAGFLPGGVRGVQTLPLSTTGGGGLNPPCCWQRKWEYIPDFAVISAKIGHFKHSNLKKKNLLGEATRRPTPFGPPFQTFLAETLARNVMLKFQKKITSSSCATRKRLTESWHD